MRFPCIRGDDPTKGEGSGGDPFFSPHTRGVIPIAFTGIFFRVAFPRTCGDAPCVEVFGATIETLYNIPAVQKEGENMNIDQNEALLRAILELIEKCKTIEELRESVKQIMNEEE